MPIDRRTVTAEGAPEAVGPYSHAVRTGDLLFCSGQVPLDPATGKLVEGGPGEQATRCLENLSIVCAAAGARLQDAVRIGVFVTDMSSFAEVNEAYAAFFDTDPPARAAIGVGALPLGARVEVEAVVAVG